MTGAGRTHWAPDPTSWRTSPRPVGWKRIRAAVLHRDGHQCTWVEQGQRCPATVHLEVDHIGDPDDHSPDNLRVLCAWHHARRTGRQARAAQLARREASARRERRAHPGLLG